MSDPQSVLLYGGHVLTMDADATVVPEAELLLDGGSIAAIGRALTVTPATRVLDVQGQLIVPGLVQGHVHLGQTFFRGLAEGRTLLAWLRERIWPLEAAHDDESAYWCTLLGAAECLLGGTTTVQDIGIGPGARGYLKALAQSGLRAVAGKCLMDTGVGLSTARTAEHTSGRWMAVGRSGPHSQARAGGRESRTSRRTTAGIPGRRGTTL